MKQGEGEIVKKHKSELKADTRFPSGLIYTEEALRKAAEHEPLSDEATEALCSQIELEWVEGPIPYCLLSKEAFDNLPDSIKEIIRY